MKLLWMRIENWKGVATREIQFGDGITLLVGPNEVGKSTTAEALRLLFDQGSKSHSKSKEVREAQPKGRDVGPEVEALIAAGPYRLRYLKRFLKRPATELHIEAPKEEQLAGDDAHRRFHEILSAHVDETLFRALWIQQGQRLRFDPKSGAQSGWLMNALDRAAGNSSGLAGEGAELIERVEAERLRYFSAKQGEPTGAYLQLRDEVEQREEDCQALRDDHAQLERAIEEHRGLEERIAHAKQRLPGLLADAERIGAERDTAKRRMEEITQRGREMLSLTKLAEGAREATRQRQASLRRLNETAQRIADKERELALQAAQVQAKAAAHQAQVGLLQLADAEVAQRQRIRAAHAVDLKVLQLEREWADADAYLQVLDRRVARASSLRAAAREELKEESFAALRKHLKERDQLRARVEAGAPRIEIEALRAMPLDVDGAARALEVGDREEIKVLKDTQIQIGDLARLAVHVEALDPDAKARLRALEEQVRADLVQLGLRAEEDFEELYNSLLSARVELKVAEENLQAHLKSQARNATASEVRTNLLAKMEVLQRHVSDWKRTRDGEVPMPSDIAAAEAATEAAEAALLVAQNKFKSSDQACREAERAADRERTQWQTAETQLEELRKFAAKERAEVEDERASTSDERLAELEADAAKKEREASLALSELREESAAIDLPALEHLAKEASRAHEHKQRELREAELALASCSAKLDAAGARGLGEKLEAAEVALEYAQRDLARMDRRAAAAQKLYTALMACRLESGEALRRPLEERISRLGRLVFGTTFAAALDEQLNLSSRTLDGVRLDFDQLSFGTQEQLDLLLRLSIAQSVSEDGGVPLLFDDTLGSADPIRSAALARLLALPSFGASEAQQVQVIVFTCHPDRFEALSSAKRIDLERSLPSVEA